MASANKKQEGKSEEKKTGQTKKQRDLPSGEKPRREKPPVYTPNNVARGVGAAVCVLFAVILFLGMFGVKDAVVVDILCHGVKGLIGYGFWIVAPILVVAAILLLARRQKPVRLRLWCLGFLPLLVGALFHLLLSPYTYEMGLAAFSALWRDGIHGFSGGVLGGMLGISFAAWFSPIGAGIFFVLAAALLLAGVFHITPVKVVGWIRASRDRRWEEEEEDYDYDDRGRYADRDRFQEEDPNALPPVQPREPEGIWPAFLPRKRLAPAKKRMLDVPLDAPAEQKRSPAGELADVADTLTFDDPLPLVGEPLAEEPAEKPAQRRAAIRREAQDELEGTLARLSGILTSFGIDGHVTGAVQGPSVTRYEIALEQGVRLNKLTNLSDDVALALGVSSVRIAPVPGKSSVVGIEVPNTVVTPVPIREVLESEDFRRHKSSAAFSVGKDIGGSCIVGDCAKLPHLLIAGTTGSGKSVCINSLLVSMLYKSTPEELRLIMVDPKMVELGGYNGIPHLLIPVVTDPKKAAGALQWAVTEMMKRYRLFAEAGVRELNGYNQWARSQGRETIPKVVIVIDELADLMLVAAKEVEESICRVAQMGRASGMHLVIATQRPSADVITGLMKANIPSRVAFAVASALESRIILDNPGAEKLVGKGDMLWFPLGSGKPLRVQGCFISDEEVAAVVSSVKQNSVAEYDEDVLEQIEQHVSEAEKKGGKTSGGGYPAGEDPAGEQDELFPAAVDVILELGQASVSMLQRRLKLGYARAARLVDQMEEQGIVGPFEGSKPRQILITREQWQQMQGGESPGEDNPPVEEEILPFEAVPQKTE